MWARPGLRRAMGVGLLIPGLLVALPVIARPETSPSKPPARKPHAKAPVRSRMATAPPACSHTVRKGDSIARIASRHGVTRQALTAANQLSQPAVLRPGRRLTIPGCAARRGEPGREVAQREAAGRGRPPHSLVLRDTVADNGILLARVGPRRVPTQLFLGIPEPEPSAPEFIWPVIGPVASAFGRRRNGWHAGIDIKADAGTPILAAAAGTVVFSGQESFYGRFVRIEHAGGFLTLYAHNQQNLVETGDIVEAGTVVATVGSSGRSTAHHLHFEIRRDGLAYDPLRLLNEPSLVLARADEPIEPAPAIEEGEDE